mgnify:CR=1 FL=1|jgi:hypothetical protein
MLRDLRGLAEALRQGPPQTFAAEVAERATDFLCPPASERLDGRNAKAL